MTKTPNTTAFDAIAHIAAAYAARPDVTQDDILRLVARLSAELKVPNNPALTGLPAAAEGETGEGPSTAAAAPAGTGIRPTPALPIDRAVADDKVYCLCCGKGFKMLKRHLGAEHGLTEDEYRALFDLPAEMPLVAPSYSERKAAYARKVGLGKYSREGASA